MQPFLLNIRRKILRVSRPAVMGILNVTPDSFFSASRTLGTGCPESVANQAARLIAEGADIIDVGGCSTRPGSDPVSVEEEARRVRAGVEAVRSISADIPVSVDTFRSEVARRAVEQWGADIINDISAGMLDPEMIPTVASLHVPYIMMHSRGCAADMQSLTDYPSGVVAGVAQELRSRIVSATMAGVADIIIDPGFGFAKTTRQNYELLHGLSTLQGLLDGLPMLVGLSRKSMIYRPLGITPADALPGSIALAAAAAERGAAIIRTHDPAATRQGLDAIFMLHNPSSIPD